MLPKQKIKALSTMLLLAVAATLLLHLTSGQAVTGVQAETSAQTSAPAESDGTTRLFDLSGQKIAELAGLPYAFSPDGQRLLTVSRSGASLFDMSGTKLAEFQSFTQFSPDGQRIVASGGLYDATGQKLAELPGRSLRLPMFSPNGERMIVLSNDSSYLLDASGRQIAQIQGRLFDLGGGFDSVGQRFILSRLDDLANGSPTCDLFNLSGQTIAQLPGACAGASPDGQSFLAGTGTLGDPSHPLPLYLYDFSGKKIAQLAASSPIFSSDKKFILTGEYYTGDSSYLYNSLGEKIAQLQGMYGKFSPDNQRIITLSKNDVHLYDLSGKEIARSPGNQAAFLPKSASFLTFLLEDENQPPNASPNENQPPNSPLAETRLFDASGHEVALLTGSPSSFFDIIWSRSYLLLPPNLVPEASLTLTFSSPDGERIVTNDSQKSYLYDSSGKKIAELQGIFQKFSPSGQHLVTASAGKVYLYDRSGAKVTEFGGNFVLFSPDGQHLTISSSDTVS